MGQDCIFLHLGKNNFRKKKPLILERGAKMYAFHFIIKGILNT
jgi:hypothetical protein